MCKICEWIKKKERIVYETSLNIVIQPDITYNPYCLLICPKKHYENINEMPESEKKILINESYYFGSKLEGKLGIKSIRYIQNNLYWKISDSPLSLNHVHINLLAVFDKTYSLEPENRKRFSNYSLTKSRKRIIELLKPDLSRKVILIEGINGCGKDTILSIINDYFIDSTEIRFHGFYFKHGKRIKNRKYLMSYNRSKLIKISKIFKEFSYDDFIISRFHISDNVLSEYYFKKINSYNNLEHILKKQKAILILLDVSKKSVLKERLKQRQSRSVNMLDISPQININDLWCMRNRFLGYFQKSCLKKKVIDTTQFSPQEIVEQILSFAGVSYAKS